MTSVKIHVHSMGKFRSRSSFDVTRIDTESIFFILTAQFLCTIFVLIIPKFLLMNNSNTKVESQNIHNTGSK